MIEELNLFITALSPLSPKNFTKYEYEIGDERYPGYFSGEPGIRYVVRNMAMKGKLIDKFILLCSKTTMSKIDISSLLNDEDKDCLERHLGFGCDGFSQSADRVEMTAISAYEYIEAIIKCEVMAAYNADDGEALNEWVSTHGFCDYDGSFNVEKYIESACHINEDGDAPLEISDNPNIDELKRNIEKQMGYSKTINIYTDITGGTRITSIVSLLMARWYVQRGENAGLKVAVKKVLYSSIMDNPKLLIDWTENYELFKIADSKVKLKEVTILNRNSEEILSEEEIKEIGQYINEATGNVINSPQEIRKRIEFLKIIENKLVESTSMSSFEWLGRVQKAIEDYSKEAVQQIYSLDEDSSTYQKDFITGWYNNIMKSIQPVMCVNLKICNKFTKTSDITNEHEKYYRQVLQNIKDILEFLSGNLAENPKSHWECRQQIDNDRIYNKKWPDYKNRIWKGANRHLNEYFIENYGTERIKVFRSGNFFSGFQKDYQKTLLTYESRRNRFFNYGFPFACIDQSNNILDEIRDYYLNKAEEFFDDLMKEYQKGHDPESNYYKLLMACQKDSTQEESTLAEKIPKMSVLGTKYLQINEEKFESREEGEQFIEKFSELYEETRPYRNAWAHMDDEKLSWYRMPENSDAMIRKIKKWMEKEYNKICPCVSK